MKKITIFSLHLGYGGIEQSVVNLANLLCNDYEVEIISTYKLADTPAFDISDKVKVVYLIDKYKPNREEWKLALKKFRLIKLIKETYKALVVLLLRRVKTKEAMRECSSDIMISTRVLFNKWLGETGRSKAYKIAWEHNHHHEDMDYAKGVVNSCRKLDTLVLVSDSLRAFYKKMMRENNIKCKCAFIPNMLDYVPDTTSKLNEKRIISVGRLSKEKGYVDLIEIFNKFHHKYPDWHLDIVGNGSERNKIVDRIYEYHLNDSVTVHGYLKKKELHELLSKASIYLMTSYTESFGIVLIEAMSYGIPCISFTSAEGANDLITNGENGFLIENRNFDGMIEKMSKLADNKKLRIELGKNARNFSLNYSSDSIKKDWLDLLKRKA